MSEPRLGRQGPGDIPRSVLQARRDPRAAPAFPARPQPSTRICSPARARLGPGDVAGRRGNQPTCVHRAGVCRPSSSAGTREPVAYIRGVQEFWADSWSRAPCSFRVPRPSSWSRSRLYLAGPAAPGSPTSAPAAAASRSRSRSSVDPVVRPTSPPRRCRSHAQRGATRRRTTVSPSYGAYLAGRRARSIVIVSNPPYVAARDARRCRPKSCEYEPPWRCSAEPTGSATSEGSLLKPQPSLAPAGMLGHGDRASARPRTRRGVATLPALELIDIREDLQGIPASSLIQPTVCAELCYGLYSRHVVPVLPDHRGEIPSKKVYEDEDLIAFEDINPQAPLHFLVVPAANRDAERPPARRRRSSARWCGARPQLPAARRRSRDRTVFNCNSDAGQTVFHIHLHVLGGRRLGWPPG